MEQQLLIMTTSLGQYIAILEDESATHYEFSHMLNVTERDNEGRSYLLTHEPLPLLMLGDKYPLLKNKMEKRNVFMSSTIDLQTDADLPNRFRKMWDL